MICKKWSISNGNCRQLGVAPFMNSMFATQDLYNWPSWPFFGCETISCQWNNHDMMPQDRTMIDWLLRSHAPLAALPHSDGCALCPSSDWSTGCPELKRLNRLVILGPQMFSSGWYEAEPRNLDLQSHQTLLIHRTYILQNRCPTQNTRLQTIIK